MAKKLLLVEDNLSIQHVVRTIFSADDFEVVVTGDATEGLHTVESWIPDVVLADASMPGIDGFQLCQIIRNTASVRHIPVVLLTSRFAAYDALKGDRVGATAHLPKPFDSHVLFEMVQQLVAPGFQSLSETIPGIPSGTMATVYQEGQRVPTQESKADALQALKHSEDTVQNPGSPAASHLSPDALSEALHTLLGRDIVQLLHHTIEAQIASLLDKITPQIVEAVREAVMAQTPPLLEMLLQQEIDRLKQAVQHDDTWSLKP
jgi:CheY-like chemotaxis protein